MPTLPAPAPSALQPWSWGSLIAIAVLLGAILLLTVYLGLTHTIAI